MDFTVILLDPTILDEGYTMGALWLMRESLYKIKDSLEMALNPILQLDAIQKVNKIKVQLNHVIYNIGMVEYTMTSKETLVFEQTEFFTDGNSEIESISLN